MDRFLDGAAPSALVVEGEAGIGKTTIWRLAVATAARRGDHVLAAAPAEGEAALPYAALGDLLAGVPAGITDGLPGPLRSSLDAALHEAPPGEGFGVLAVARGLLETVRALSATRPVLVAVDDVQWLDPPTAGALEFAARRLQSSAVRVLLARRSDRDQDAPLALDRAPLRGGLERLRVAPLTVDEVDLLLRSRLRLRLPRPTLVRLTRDTGGNAYYALEIARGFAEHGELVVPASLADALAGRVASLPNETRQALLLAAACAQPSADLVERAAGGGAAVEDAIARGMLDVEGDRLRFNHPLLASVTYDRALPGERREAHRLLAAVSTDVGERALHLARGLDDPHEPAAAELEEAAGIVASRGGAETAAELAEASARLTPKARPTDARRRLVTAAEHHVAAGDPDRAREILAELVDGVEPGPERAALLWRLADTIGDSIDEPIALCEQALGEAGPDPLLRSEIHTALGVFTWIAGDLEGATDHCLQAVSCAEEAGDEQRLAVAIGEACHAQAILGVPWDREAIERALEIERRGVELPPSMRPSVQLAVIALVTDDLETARPLLEAEARRVRDAGDEPGLVHALWRISELELRAGRWERALEAAREAVVLGGQSGIAQERATTEMALAAVLAHLGELEEARALAEAAYAAADAGGDRAVVVRCAGVLGLVELSLGRPDAALDWLTPAREEVERMGTAELSISAVVQNEIEALVEVGRLDEADDVVSFVEAKARRSSRSWHRAVAARGRALTASARGEPAAAREAIEEAMSAHASLPQPFELARTLLAAGGVERRAKSWAAARERTTAALELFDDLGAARWAERAATELARLPGRRPRGTELTETERRVAELVAEGLANKEVAARLHVSVRTVEANLTKVYAKLGIRSRTELARRLAH